MKKLKILMIDRCSYCKSLDKDSSYCKLKNIEIKNIETIPEWCPLQNYGE